MNIRLVLLAVCVAVHGFSSGVFIPQLIHHTKINRPFSEKVPEDFVLGVIVGDKGEVKGIKVKGCLDKTGTYGWDACPSSKQNDVWLQVIQKEVKKHWKYTPKIKFAMYYIMEVSLVITDEDFHPLKPRR